MAGPRVRHSWVPLPLGPDVTSGQKGLAGDTGAVGSWRVPVSAPGPGSSPTLQSPAWASVVQVRQEARGHWNVVHAGRPPPGTQSKWGGDRRVMWVPAGPQRPSPVPPDVVFPMESSAPTPKAEDGHFCDSLFSVLKKHGVRPKDAAGSFHGNRWGFLVQGEFQRPLTFCGQQPPASEDRAAGITATTADLW